MDFDLVINELNAADYLRLIESTGWGSQLHEQQVEAGLKNSLLTVSAVLDGQVIGMGRLVGDLYMICYIQEVVILPEYQGKGIGSAIIENLLSFIRDNAITDTCLKVGLFSAKGKEGYYEKLGFIARPHTTGNDGAGMLMKVHSKV